MNQFDQNLEALINDLPIVISDNIFILAQDAKALIQQRVQEKGLNALGGKTPDYSPSYKKQREKKGRQVGFMDLTMTGDMWQSTGVTDRKQEGEKFTATLAGRDEFAQLKIDVNSKKHFEVLKLSTDEEKVLEQFFDEYFTNNILEYLNRGIE